MSSYEFQGSIYNSDNFDSVSGNGYFYTQQGDTIRVLQQRTVTNSTDPGYTGEICFDSNYIYYCVSGDGTTCTWKRVAFQSY